MSRATIMDVLEVAWDLKSGQQDWLHSVMEATAHALPQSVGSLACGVTANVRQTGMRRGDPDFNALNDLAVATVPDASLTRVFASRAHAVSIREVFSSRCSLPQGVVEKMQAMDLEDVFALTLPVSERHLMLAVGVPRTRSRKHDTQRRWRARAREWSAVARHLQRVCQVRESLGNFDGVIPVQGTQRNIIEAAPVGEAVLADSVPSSLWEALVGGHHSIVYQTCREARLRCLMVENPSPDRSLRALTKVERTVVERVADGASDTSISLDLGIQRASVSNIVRRALRKLGLEKRTHLAHLHRQLSTTPIRPNRPGCPAFGEHEDDRAIAHGQSQEAQEVDSLLHDRE